MYQLQKHFILLRTIFNHRFQSKLNHRHRFIYQAWGQTHFHRLICPFRSYENKISNAFFILTSLTLRPTVLTILSGKQFGIKSHIYQEPQFSNMYEEP